MQEPNQQNVEAIVGKVDQQGSVLRVTFVCPITEKEVEGRATMRRSNTNSMGSSIRRSLINNFMRSIRRWLYQLLGRGVQGRIASDLITTAARGANERAQYTKADRQAATVEAFKNVREHFVWDPQIDRWVHKSTETIGA